MKKITVVLVSFLLPLVALAGGKTATVAIDGMHCSSCMKAIESELKKMPEVSAVKMDLKKGTALVSLKDGAQMTKERLSKAVEEAGYTTKSVEGI